MANTLNLSTRLARKVLFTGLRRLAPEQRESLFQDVLEQFAESTRYRYGMPSLSESLRTLQRTGFSPSFVVDIGAYRGEWTRTAFSVFPNARFLMVEANPEQESYLAKTVADLGERVSFVRQLLGPETKPDVLFYQVQTGSSVLEELTTFEKQQIRIPMAVLDDLMSAQQYTLPLLLKLDVQGFELEVLKGARETLRQAEVVLLETTLLPYNKGAPSFAEVIAFMNEMDYSAFDITDLLRRQTDGVLFMLDLLFVRKSSKLREHRKFWLNEP